MTYVFTGVGNGADMLFSAVLEPNSARGKDITQYYKHWQAVSAARHIELIPQLLASSSGPNDVTTQAARHSLRFG